MSTNPELEEDLDGELDDEELEDEELEDETIDEKGFEGLLAEAIRGHDDLPITRIRTFARAGLRYNRGLVVDVDGAQFQITIVRSR